MNQPLKILDANRIQFHQCAGGLSLGSHPAVSLDAPGSVLVPPDAQSKILSVGFAMILSYADPAKCPPSFINQSCVASLSDGADPRSVIALMPHS